MENKSDTASSQISFRVTPGIAAELAEQASQVGMSPGEYARKLVIDSLAANIEGNNRPLTRSDLDGVLDEVRLMLAGYLEASTLDGKKTTLVRQLRRLREDLATTVLALLVGVGKQEVKEVTGWVEENLMTEIPK